MSKKVTLVLLAIITIIYLISAWFVDLLDSDATQYATIAMQMNAELMQWLKTHQAPTGTWRVNGKPVAYPAADMVSFEIPDQSKLTPMKKEMKANFH